LKIPVYAIGAPVILPIAIALANIRPKTLDCFELKLETLDWQGCPDHSAGEFSPEDHLDEFPTRTNYGLRRSLVP
jgi:hypothetical protein